MRVGGDSETGFHWLEATSAYQYHGKVLKQRFDEDNEASSERWLVTGLGGFIFYILGGSTSNVFISMTLTIRTDCYSSNILIRENAAFRSEFCIRHSPVESPLNSHVEL